MDWWSVQAVLLPLIWRLQGLTPAPFRNTNKKNNHLFGTFYDDPNKVEVLNDKCEVMESKVFLYSKHFCA